MANNFDNVFTDRIFFGSKNLNLTNPLTSKLWKKLPLNIKNTLNAISPTDGYFFIAKTFNENESKIIIDEIQNNGMVYFDNNGNLEVDDKTTLAVKLKYKNILSKNDFNDMDKGNIFSNSTGQSITLIRNDLILSKNKYWILYTENSICYILYNPIHRQSFKNYYNSQTFDSNGASNNLLNNIFNQYCEIMSTQNDTNLLRTYADGVCNCIREDDCIDNATGTRLTNKQARNSVGKNCVCAAPNCDDGDVTITSFMYKDGLTGFKDRRIQTLPNKTCPSIQNVICTTEINAAGNVSLAGSKISQQCGNQQETPAPTSATTSTSAPTSAPTSTTTSAPTSTTTSAPTSTTTRKPTTTTKKPVATPASLVPAFCSIL
jgi:cell division septation protein DedD